VPFLRSDRRCRLRFGDAPASNEDSTSPSAATTLCVGWFGLESLKLKGYESRPRLKPPC
jgi:hypothetical protein